MSTTTPIETAWVASGSGGLGSSLSRALHDRGVKVFAPSRRELDLCDLARVAAYVSDIRPDVVFLTAAATGGVQANLATPLPFLEDNIQIQIAVMRGAAAAGCRRLVFAGSTAVYSDSAPQPYREEDAARGVDASSEHALYGLAKYVGMQQCAAYSRTRGCRYVTALLTNLYGANGRIDPTRSNVLTGVMRRAIEARRVGAEDLVVWGDGEQRRDFLHYDDAAEAMILIAERSDAVDAINVGSGSSVSIRDAAKLIRGVVGFQGTLLFDETKPVGVLSRDLNVSRLASLGFAPRTSLKAGLATLRDDLERRIPSPSA